ncbi:COP1-interacting protein 7-like [Triticum dicoccoides]|uniref:COP1-interacting protein 7-like n=1 Tax=Triticum dicoccoides TaxID=85692 RepID=UPI001890D8F7|nr:COP1-interacting protein 7-like [Triticum dicoccoides]
MRPEARLDSAAFQLTPTRTRCDLVVVVNGRKEKIASGLLNPFVAHLKVAQEQIAKGGYTILLQPDPGADAPWFTRGTIQRFVRFVSTPEVLERVTTIESEILQLQDAIAVQNNANIGLKSAEGHNVDSSMEGSKTSYDPDGDKALVLYKPDTHPASPLQNDTGVHEEHSKVQLLRVLETRKTVLRKEQAMAFARAVAAGFDIDNLIYLISFAERFGASRLMKACTQFIDLWRQKHETGQWIDVEPEAMSARSEFPPFNAAGIMLMGDKETMSVSNGDTNGEDAAKADHRTPQHPGAPHHGPYQSGYPPWAMHPPYPMQGMPPYYPGANPYYPPPYPPTDDPRYNRSERRLSRRHSADSKDFDNSDDESDDQSGSERESSHGRKSSKKGNRSGKKKSNVIVIRNVNVTSRKKHGSSESESQSGSDVASEDSDDSHRKSSKRNHHKRSSSKKKGDKKTTVESEDEYTKDGMSNGQQDGDQGNWNAFQNFLLRDEEKTRDHNDADMFASEREAPQPPRRKETTRSIDDPILLSERGSADVNERHAMSFSSANGRIRARQMMSGDELMMSAEGRSFVDGGMKEIEAGGGGYRRGANDDFMVYGQDNSMDRRSSLDPLAEAHYKRPTPLEEKKNVHSMGDESFMIPVTSNSQDNLGAAGRTAIDIDAELGSSVQKTSDAKAGAELFYEPDELIPERGFEDVSFGYDPSMDYDSHMQIQHDVSVEDANAEDLSVCVEGEEKMPGKDKKLRGSQEGVDKRRKDASARRLSAPKGPLTDAQKRAQNLRAYKVSLQKEKKELEAEQMKRLERLKQEREKRIAARSGASNPQKTTAKASAVSKSTSSLAEMKKEKSGGTTESLIERLKKLAQPKTNASTLNHKSATADHPRRRSLPQ